MKDNYSHIDDKIFYTVTNISSNDDQENLAVACQCVNDCTISKDCQCLLISGGINYDTLSRFSLKKEPIFECTGNFLRSLSSCKKIHSPLEIVPFLSQVVYSLTRFTRNLTLKPNFLI